MGVQNGSGTISKADIAMFLVTNQCDIDLDKLDRACAMFADEPLSQQGPAESEANVCNEVNRSIAEASTTIGNVLLDQGESQQDGRVGETDKETKAQDGSASGNP